MYAIMAYTLTDPYRPLRTVLRMSSAITLIAGASFVLLSRPTLVSLGLAAGDVAWPVRLAGAALITLGLYFVMAANETAVSTPAIVTCIVGNAAFALVMLMAYLGQELAGLSLLGRIAFILVFLLCLVSAVVPVRYLRAEFRTD